MVADPPLLEQTRRPLAEGSLADPRLTLAEVGYLCGDEEQASVFHADRPRTVEPPTPPPSPGLR